MARKIGILMGVAASCALITSCGGDDTPDPVPTDTASPTPTPTTGMLDFSFTSDFAATQNNANIIYAYFTPDGGMEVFSAGSRINGSSRLTFALSPETVSFTFPDLSDTVSFDAGDLVNFVTTPQAERTYARGDEQLELLVPFEHVLQAQYRITNQPFTRDAVDGTLRSERVALFFNQVTTTDDITANLTYTGTPDVAGGDPGVTRSGTISAANTTFTISAADDTVSGTIAITSTSGNVTTTVASLPFSASVGNNGTFAGDISDGTYDLEGSFAGSLAGPNRNELFLLFSVGDPDPDDDDDTRFVGTFIGD